MSKIQIFKMAVGLAAAFFAAVGVCIAFACGYALLSLPTSKESGAQVADGLLFIAVSAAYVSAVMAFLAIVLIALPHIIISHRLRHSSRNYYVWSGIAIGLLVVIVAAVHQRLYPGPPFHMGSDEYFYIVSGIAAGAISSLTFWSIARPDRWQRGRLG